MTRENTPDTWENRIETASKIMGLEPSETETILDSEGYEITSSDYRMEMISDENVTPFGDLRKLFCDSEAKVPVPKLRMAMKYLRGPSESPKTDSIDPDLLDLQTKYGIKTSLEDLDIAQLLPYYKPNRKNKIHDILIKRYQDKYGAFIAFKAGTQYVAIEETVDYVTDLETGYQPSKTIFVDGDPVKLYKVGELPNQMITEDPLFPGQPLKRDRSMVNHVNWSKIGYDKRTFFRFLLQRNEINPNNRVEVAQLFVHTIDELKDMFPETYIEWKEANERNELPKLEIPVSSLSTATSTRTNNPFSVSNNRTY